jgi:hypothetical protein
LEQVTGIVKREIHIPVNVRTAEMNAIRALDLPSPGERHDALEKLLTVGQEDTVKDVLADAVRNATFGDVRTAAAIKYVELTDSPDSRVLPGLIEALSQDDAAIRDQAAHAIAHILDRSTESRNRSFQTRYSSLKQVLARTGQKRAARPNNRFRWRKQFSKVTEIERSSTDRHPARRE